jgi:hypothetical protein
MSRVVLDTIPNDKVRHDKVRHGAGLFRFA